MKKSLVSAILGLAAIASVQAQGNINLYNYASGGSPANMIVYGPGSGGAQGVGVTTGGFTVGMYVVLGDSAASINNTFSIDGTSFGAVPGTQASGVGATTPLGDFEPGEYSSGFEYTTGAAAGGTVTVVVVAYNGANYGASLVRGHSQAFTMATTLATEGAPTTGAFMNGFAVSAVPEPSTFALAGLGLAGLLIFRRRK